MINRRILLLALLCTQIAAFAPPAFRGLGASAARDRSRLGALDAKKRRRSYDENRDEDLDFWYNDRDAAELLNSRMDNSPAASSQMDGWEVHRSAYDGPQPGGDPFAAPGASMNGQSFDMSDLPEGVSFTPAFVPESIEEWERFIVDDDFDLRKEDVEAIWDAVLFASDADDEDVAGAAEGDAGAIDPMEGIAEPGAGAPSGAGPPADLLLDPSAAAEGFLSFGVPEDQRVPAEPPAEPVARCEAAEEAFRSGSGLSAADAPTYPFTERWVSALSEVSERTVTAHFENWGVETVSNFPPGAWALENVDKTTPLADIAVAKAQYLADLTGMPALAGASSVDVEAFGSRRNAVNARFRMVDEDDLSSRFVEMLRLTARPGTDTRAVEFEWCLALVDPREATASVAVEHGFAASEAAVASAEMGRMALELACQLLQGGVAEGRPDWYWEPPAWRTQGPKDAPEYEVGTQKLQERLLREGRVLESSIVDVSAFMDGFVDTALINDCGAALAGRFAALRPTKVLTVATTGLAVAVPVSSGLQVPMIYARKQRSVIMADSYVAGYSSRTVGKQRELLIAKGHIAEGDRVLIIDDFLSSGACQDALLRMLGEAGAECIGVGVLFEKQYEAGRQYLSGYDIKIESLAKIKRVDRGTIELDEEMVVDGDADADGLGGDGPPPSSLKLRGVSVGRM